MAKDAKLSSPQKKKHRFQLLYLLIAVLTFALFWGLMIPSAYRDPGDDIFGPEFIRRFAYTLLWIILIPTFCAEAELFYTVYYFTNVQKRKTGKTVCHFLSLTLSLLTVVFLFILFSQRYMDMKSAQTCLFLSFGTYLAVRIVSLFLPKPGSK